MTTPTPQPVRRTKTKARPARRSRRALRVVAWSVIGLVLLALIVTRTTVLGVVVRPAIRGALGCDVSTGRVILQPNGRLAITNLRLSVPGMRGEAALFFRARRVDLDVDWGALFAGGRPVDRVVLNRPVFRLSQSIDDGLLNVQRLPTRAGDGGSLRDLPEIELRRAVLDLGEHGADGAYEQLMRMLVDGDALRRPDAPHIYNFRLRELPDDAALDAREPTRLVGEIDTELIHGVVSVTDVDLAQWGEQWSPRWVRDVWLDMEIRGRISSAVMAFDSDAGLGAEFMLDGVRMTLPIAAHPHPDDPPTLERTRRMVMRDARGVVWFNRSGMTGNFSGDIEGVRYRVAARTVGLALNAPFVMEFETVESIVVGEQLDLMPFAPDIVRRRFESFSGPTASLDASVRVERGPPSADGTPAAPLVSGALRFRNGAAAYEHFPYWFGQMEGLVRFNESEIEIVYVNGVGPTGARLSATGRIAPPTEGASVSIDVAVVDIDMDERFEAAMPESRRPIIEALFDRAEHARLHAAGAVITSAESEQTRAALNGARARLLALSDDASDAERAAHADEVAVLERRASIPVFDLAGRADLDIRIRREIGEASEWTRTIDVRLARAGMLVSAFPYPVIARDVVLRIDEARATADMPRVAGLTGASGALRADIRLLDDAGKDVFDPVITVEALNVPVDELLILAIPDASSEDLSARRALRALGVRGDVSCLAHVSVRDDGRAGFDVDIGIDRLRASPGASAEAQPLVTDLSGRMRVTERGVNVEAVRGRIGDAPFTLDVDAEFADPERDVHGHISATVMTESLDLATPVERVLGAVYPPAQTLLADLRTQRRPAGVIDAVLDARASLRPAAGGAVMRAHVHNVRDVSFELLGGRVGAESNEGVVVYEPGRVAFEAFRAPITFDDEYAGNIALDGELLLDGAAAVRGDLRVAFEQWRVESPLVRTLLGATGRADRLADALGESVFGHFDGEARYVLRTRGDADITGEIRPTDLVVRSGEYEARFDDVIGRVILGAEGGVIESLRLDGADIHATVEGSWRMPAGAPAVVDLRIGAGADALNSAVRAVLPEGANDAIDAIEAASDGPIALEDAELRLVLGGAPGRDAASFRGLVRFEDASFVVGAPVRRVRGTLTVNAQRAPGDRFPTLDLTLRADSLSVAGVRVHDGVTRIVSGGEPGEFLAPVLEARSHGGRVSGRAVVRRQSGSDERIRYEVRLDAAGVAFAPMLDDLSEKIDLRAHVDEQPASPGRRALRRGVMDASFALAGVAGDPDSRFGRGALRVSGGEVVRLPLLVNLIELSNLALPAGDELDFAVAAYYIRGETLTFEQLSVSSDAITIAGQGTIRWPGLDVDLRFNSRSHARVPLLSDLLEGLRDEIATITVAGTLNEPKFGVSQLSGTRRLLDSMFGTRNKGQGRQPGAAQVERRDQ